LMAIVAIAITDGSRTAVHSVFEITLIIGLSEHQLLSIDLLTTHSGSNSATTFVVS
jgi:hypothetical protein